MTEFIKVGEQIRLAPQGLNYELRTDITYKLKYDNWEGICYLTEEAPLDIPENLFTGSMDKFINKVLVHHKDSEKSTTGVLMSGMKGSGKTITAKRLAALSELPMIIIDPSFPSKKLMSVFNKMNTDVCIMFDEVDKNTRNWESKDLLGFLDGIETATKKLVIFTCNDEYFANENLIDRCSRIHYHKKYTGLSEDDITNIVADILDNKDNVNEVSKFIVEKIETKSYDNIISFIKEINRFPEHTLDDIISDMNITIKE